MIAFISHYGRPENPAVQILTDRGEPFMIASVNIDFLLNPGLIAIKNWSENEFIEEELQQAGIIGEKVSEVPSGYVSIPIYELLIRPDE